MGTKRGWIIGKVLLVWDTHKEDRSGDVCLAGPVFSLLQHRLLNGKEVEMVSFALSVIASPTAQGENPQNNWGSTCIWIVAEDAVMAVKS
ncbi:hypothetical protein ACFLXF_03335 [Chloroflexota bacterium]